MVAEVGDAERLELGLTGIARLEEGANVSHGPGAGGTLLLGGGGDEAGLLIHGAGPVDARGVVVVRGLLADRALDILGGGVLGEQVS